MQKGACRSDQLRHFFPAENGRQLTRTFGIRYFLQRPMPLQHAHEEKSQPGYPLRYGIRLQLAFAEQISLIVANMLQTQLIGRAVKITCEILDRPNVNSSGILAVITTLEFIEHRFA